MEQYTMAMTLFWLMVLLGTMATMFDPEINAYKSPKAWVVVVISAVLSMWGASVL